MASADHQHADELHTERCLDVVEQLHELGVGAVTLIDGDTVLRDDLLLIAEAIVQRGIRCKPCVAGPGITRLAAEALAHMGIRAASVGLDGNAFSHDDARARRGAHRAVLAAIEHLRSVGVDVTVHTRITRLTLDTLDELFDTLRAYGVRRWQPILSAAPRQQFEIDPALAREELLALRRRLAEFRQRAHPAQIRWIPAPPPAALIIGADGTFTPNDLTVPDALKGPPQ